MQSIRLTIAWLVLVLGVAVLALGVSREWLMEPYGIEWVDPEENEQTPLPDAPNGLLIVDGLLMVAMASLVIDLRDRIRA